MGEKELETVHCSRQGSFLPIHASLQAENSPNPNPNFRGNIYFYYLDEENARVSPKGKVTKTFYFNTSSCSGICRLWKNLIARTFKILLGSSILSEGKRLSGQIKTGKINRKINSSILSIYPEKDREVEILKEGIRILMCQEKTWELRD